MGSRLAGRRVLVVGAGTRPSDDPDAPIGNGRAISVLAAREGAAVACADCDADAAKETAALVEAEGAPAAVVVGDVSRRRGFRARIVDEAAQALGGLDGLVCNVGIGLGRGLEGTSAEEWDAVHAVNVRAHFLLCRAALPLLSEGGAIVFISSVAGLVGGNAHPRVRHVEGRTRRFVSPRRARGRAQRSAGQRRRAGADRHAARPGRHRRAVRAGRRRRYRWAARAPRGRLPRRWCSC